MNTNSHLTYTRKNVRTSGTAVHPFNRLPEYARQLVSAVESAVSQRARGSRTRAGWVAPGGTRGSVSR